LLRSGLYNSFGVVIRIGTGLIAVPILIRLIGLEEYGFWALISAVVGLVGVAELGLAVSTTVFLSRDIGNRNSDSISQTLTITIGLMLLVAAVATLFLWFAASKVVDFFSALQESQRLVATQALQLGAIVVGTQMLLQVFVGIEQAYQRYGILNILVSSQVILMNIGLLVVAGLGGGVVNLMRWHVVVNIGALLLHLSVSLWLLRSIKLRICWSATRGREIIRYSLFTWLVSLGSTLFSQVDRLIVGSFLGTNVLGVYAAITTVTAKINAFSAVPVQPLLPELSRLWARDNIDFTLIKQNAQKALQLNALAALGIGATLFTLAPSIMSIMLSSAATVEHVLLFRLATLIYTFYSLNAAGYYILMGTDAVDRCMVIQLAGAFLALSAIGIGVSYWGLFGAILGNVGYLTVWLLTFFAMKRLDISVRFWAAWLKLPIFWFVTVIALNFVLPDQVYFRIVTVIVTLGILLAWFITVQQIYLQSVLHKVATR
jgi:O-antigen/teichoic acid export membrane protein